MADRPIRVTVWHEYVHEKTNETVRELYPEGMHMALKAGLEELLGGRVEVRTATLEEPEHGLSQSVVDSTDVFLWWGHAAHDKVEDRIVERVQKRVLEGAGLVVLHSGHHAKVFRRLMGTDCGLRWREAEELERIWCVNPGHPIADGLPEYFELKPTEMYGEHFDIPQPDELVFVSWFEGGEVCRSGCCWRRGKGQVFYFRPGHETHAIYYDQNVKKVIANSVRYVAPSAGSPYAAGGRNIKNPPSPIGK
ncbi:MAG: ThuA domain-containing protein [Phycisphaeraceae bacterium]